MSEISFFYTDKFQHYNLGLNHPLQPIRIKRTYDLLNELGAWESIDVQNPEPCMREVLKDIHSDEYLSFTEMLSNGQRPPSYRHYGFGTPDNPVFPGMWESSLLYSGASKNAAEAVIDGQRLAINISGGLHHAHFSGASGFCIFNDCVLAIKTLLKKFQRVAYVDIDVHHGDGVQEAFYKNPQALTISIHETGKTLFPGTGFTDEIGAGVGRGYAANLPLWPYTDGETWLHAWREIGFKRLQAFSPDVVVLQMGADAHILDPLGHMNVTGSFWLEAIRDVKTLELPMVALGGGGYNQTVVPLLWSMAIMELADLQLPNDGLWDKLEQEESNPLNYPSLIGNEDIQQDATKYANSYAMHMVKESQGILRQWLNGDARMSEKIEMNH